MSFASVWSMASLWSHAMESFHWHAFTIHSHAAVLLLVYLLWYYPRSWLKDDKLLKPPRKDPRPAKSSRGILLEAPPSPIISVSSISDGEELSNQKDAVDRALEKACPDATCAERQRFMTARQGNVASATKTLQHYLSWNQKYEDIMTQHNIKQNNTEDDRDLSIWTESVAVAMKACGEVETAVSLPRVIRCHQIDNKDVTDFQGRRVLHIIPAKMDDNLAKTSTYALATALYINKQLDREGFERITVCMDVRAGRGWPNIHVMRLVPFMKESTTLLLSLFPERLHKCLLYPVPTSFLWVWNAVKRVVDPLTRDKICLLSGPNKIEAPPPFDQMCEHMEKDSAHLLENSRVSEFKD